MLREEGRRGREVERTGGQRGSGYSGRRTDGGGGEVRGVEGVGGTE